MARIILFFGSGGIAIFSYALIIVFLIWQFSVVQKSPKAYAAYKETTFSIDLIEETKPKPTIKVAQKKLKKKLKIFQSKKKVPLGVQMLV